ncbi:MAG TPA: VCBS repeat-containing protein [Myxococcota bacterium]|nr:VCBS repeat-containing protein [Myxococcota bacterium]
MRPRWPRFSLLARAAALALALAAALPAGADDDANAPFERISLPLPGRPLEAWTLAGSGSGERVAVVSALGSPPDERRHLAIYGPAPGGGVAREVVLDVPADAVAFDVADLEPGGPPELALLYADRLTVQSLGAPPAPRSHALSPALPLPAPARGFVRLPMLDRWDGSTRASALLPAFDGLLLLPLDGGAPRRLAFPLYAFYYGGDPSAGVRPGVLESFVTWPELASGDDDGDGRADVFALSRYDVAVYRGGPDGLPPQPTRRVTLRPFTDDEELRFLASSVSLFAPDLDGDGRADLVQHKTFGTLLRSHATTSIWRNPGAGVDPSAAPDARIEGSGGFGSIFLEDLDGDGRLEAVQLLVPFGAVQLVRAVLTDTVQARVRVFRFTGPGDGAPFAAEPGFEDTVTLAIETREGRVAGVLPTVAGDFDGDGLRDLVVGESLARLVVRLGALGERGPGFGSVAAAQSIPDADRAVVGDFDGDGLDDVAAWDTRYGRSLVVLRNRGRLARPGELRVEPKTVPPELRAPDAEPDPAPR